MEGKEHMTAKEYELTSARYEKLKSRGIELCCRKCKTPFKVGGTIVSKYVSSAKTARYHKKCYNSLFYEGK